MDRLRNTATSLLRLDGLLSKWSPRLIGQGADVADRLTTIGQHHRQIRHDLSRIMP